MNEKFKEDLLEDNLKIDKIDELLNDDFNLEKYINEIEEKKIEPSLNSKVLKDTNELKEKIISKVNRKKKVYYADICKIAACLIFSLVICRTDFIKNDEISKHREEKPKTSISINEKISNFCKWFTMPLEIEKEEK